ncbi:hrf1 domain-containing protein [Vairimorpha apis BRL 01]|uniref:Protein YIF1 n=1 Tax=Vairimorpha apis BRL 01 TaxID=1037528 RepID=T0L692_9MICR|nr:hrf1 domain-containing protein [Vairimorpha apis BRL 01]
MDFNTNIEIISEEEITFNVLKNDIEILLEENPNISRKEALRTGSNYVSNRIGNVNFNFLKPYFDVDDAYLINKIVLILFPYLKSQWDMDDNRINKPDLYIPMMSLFTFIIVKSMYLGLKSLFTPEHIGLIFTRLMFFEIKIKFRRSILNEEINDKVNSIILNENKHYDEIHVKKYDTYKQGKFKNKNMRSYGKSLDIYNLKYMEISSRYTVKPKKKLCEFTGLPAQFRCPYTRLYYYDSSVYKHLRQLSSDVITFIYKTKEIGKTFNPFNMTK